jgi:UDP-N-acetylmuramate--alanine ligase
MFEILGRNTRERLFINRDDLHLQKLHFERAVTFSVKSHADYRAGQIEHHPFASAFTVHGQAFSLSLPGIYNIYNALACIALLSEMGIGLKALADVLPLFSGIERRFDIHLNSGKYLVIDDYAHNPHKIASLMETAKRIRDRICYIFQPHGYGPTRLMKQGYINAFSEHLRADDHLMLLPIYYAGGTAYPDITSEDLAEPIRNRGRSAEAVPERSVIFDRLKGWDTYIVFGARDESLADFARDIAGRLT